VAQAPAPGDAVPEAPAAKVEAGPEDDAMAALAPLAPTPDKQRATSTKRTSTSRKVRPVVRSTRESFAELTTLQREWRETNALYQQIYEVHDCAALGTWCTQHKDIKRAVDAAGDNEAPATLKRVRDLKRFLLKKKQQLEY
jgi:hypothetical protein